MNPYHIFSHNGHLGDLLYALYFIKEYSEFHNIPLGGHGTTVQVQERLLPMVEELLRRNEKAES